MPKVLLVEDDNNLREIFEMRLQAEGYDTVTAGNGEEGLTVAMSEKPDLIISDVMMPKLSGFEMLETLRAAPEGKDVKVIMMTALGQAEDQARGEKLGVVKYLVKSQATLEDFARVVREVMPPAGNQADTNNQAGTVSSQNNQQGGQKMPEDPTTNPATPTDGAAMPASEPAVPPTTAPSGMPTGDQQSTSEEQSAVQGQINDFVSNAPAADSATPSADSMTAPAPTASNEPAAPAAAVPADLGASFAPPAPSEPTNPIAAPGAPDMSMPGADATTIDAPAVPPVTPPADTPPAPAPQTDAPVTDDASAMPPADPTNNAI